MHDTFIRNKRVMKMFAGQRKYTVMKIVNLLSEIKWNRNWIGNHKCLANIFGSDLGAEYLQSQKALIYINAE